MTRSILNGSKVGPNVVWWSDEAPLAFEVSRFSLL